ncbi:MAG: ribose-phosphate diphosphokinase, partial [Actinobacteria bacterium]
SVFANGEIYIHFAESVRGADCFVMQSHSHPVNFHIMEQLIMIDALKRASAKRITAVVPFFGYARQDKKGRPREPISARLMGDLFVAAGADRIASVDLHTGQIQGFVDAPFDALTALHLFIDYIGDNSYGPMTIVSPDSGRVKLASRYADHLDAQVAFIHKRRRTEARNEVTALEIVGEVNDRHCIVVDDMIDTAGTVVAAAELLKQRGALSVRVFATHGVLSPPAVDRLKNAFIEEVVITNSLPLPDEAHHLDKLTVLSIGSILAGAINAIFTDASVSAIFKGENI